VILPNLKTPLLWAMGLGLVAALATAGIERTRAAAARADASAAREEIANLRATAAESARLAERAARNTEQTWRSRVDGVIQDGQHQIAVARADAATAAAGERRLRDQLAAYRTAVRAATATPTITGGRAPAESALNLLADLLGRSGTTLRELGQFADAARAAGITCERYANSTQR